jgi:pyruvate/2-oxoglutarate dehydrogenase complex dihydrolipoamide acyltransferase (E2) component
MPIVSIRIPQMGEGLQEALLVQFHKQPGDTVRRDEAIYVMETDKATTDVESPYAGRLVEWLVKEGTVLPIGTQVATMEVQDSVSDTPTPSHLGTGHSSLGSNSTGKEVAQSAQGLDLDFDLDEDSANSSGSISIPPRTRKLLKEKGLLDIAASIPRRGNKLMPEDVERFMESQTQSASSPEVPHDLYDEAPVSKQQITLNYRLHRSVQTTVPVTLVCEIDWTALHSARRQIKESSGKQTGFAMMLWCVVQALAKHPRFRTSLVGDSTVYRTYKQVNLGVAVALPEDSLVTAAIHGADQMTRDVFFQILAQKIELARQRVDQADPSITMSVSNIGTASMRLGIPAIVSPAVATLALGEVFDAPVPKGDGFAFQKRALLTLAFDHRIINGVGAAAFMNDLKDLIQRFEL